MLDREVIEECRTGNLQNFRKIVEYSIPVAFSVAARMVGDEDEAMDIVQETMITVWKKINKINSPESYRTWLYRIVLNRCYDVLRKKKRNPEVIAAGTFWTELNECITENPGKEADNKEIANIIRTLTAKLSPKQKTVFILSELEEMSGEEISKITGMTTANIKANLHYARKRIGELLINYM